VLQAALNPARCSVSASRPSGRRHRRPSSSPPACSDPKSQLGAAAQRRVPAGRAAVGIAAERGPLAGVEGAGAHRGVSGAMITGRCHRHDDLAVIGCVPAADARPGPVGRRGSRPGSGRGAARASATSRLLGICQRPEPPSLARDDAAVVGNGSHEAGGGGSPGGRGDGPQRRCAESLRESWRVVCDFTVLRETYTRSAISAIAGVGGTAATHTASGGRATTATLSARFVAGAICFLSAASTLTAHADRSGRRAPTWPPPPRATHRPMWTSPSATSRAKRRGPGGRRHATPTSIPGRWQVGVGGKQSASASPPRPA
jgi:hypothetical protein